MEEELKDIQVILNTKKFKKFHFLIIRIRFNILFYNLFNIKNFVYYLMLNFLFIINI